MSNDHALKTKIKTPATAAAADDDDDEDTTNYEIKDEENITKQRIERQLNTRADPFCIFPLDFASSKYGATGEFKTTRYVKEAMLKELREQQSPASCSSSTIVDGAFASSAMGEYEWCLLDIPRFIHLNPRLNSAEGLLSIIEFYMICLAPEFKYRQIDCGDDEVKLKPRFICSYELPRYESDGKKKTATTHKYHGRGFDLSDMLIDALDRYANSSYQSVKTEPNFFGEKGENEIKKTPFTSSLLWKHMNFIDMCAKTLCPDTLLATKFFTKSVAQTLISSDSTSSDSSPSSALSSSFPSSLDDDDDDSSDDDNSFSSISSAVAAATRTIVESDDSELERKRIMAKVDNRHKKLVKRKKREKALKRRKQAAHKNLIRKELQYKKLHAAVNEQQSSFKISPDMTSKINLDELEDAKIDLTIQRIQSLRNLDESVNFATALAIRRHLTDFHERKLVELKSLIRPTPAEKKILAMKSDSTEKSDLLALQNAVKENFHTSYYFELKRRIAKLFTVYCNTTMGNSAPAYSKRIVWSIGNNWMIDSVTLTIKYRQLSQFLTSYKMRHLVVFEKKVVAASPITSSSIHFDPLEDSDKENHKPAGDGGGSTGKPK